MYSYGWLCPAEYVQYYLKYIVKFKTSQLSSLFASHETIKLYQVDKVYANYRGIINKQTKEYTKLYLLLKFQIMELRKSSCSTRNLQN